MMPSSDTSSVDSLDVLYSLLGILISVGAVVVCIAVGWILIWKFFLSRFEFIREIVNSGAGEGNKTVAATSDRREGGGSAKQRRSSKLRKAE